MPVLLPKPAASSRERSSSSSGVPLKRALVPAGRVSLPKDNERAVVPRANFHPAKRRVEVATRKVTVKNVEAPLTIPRVHRRVKEEGVGHRIPRNRQAPRPQTSPNRSGVVGDLAQMVRDSLHTQADVAQGMAEKLAAQRRTRRMVRDGMTVSSLGEVTLTNDQLDYLKANQPSLFRRLGIPGFSALAALAFAVGAFPLSVAAGMGLAVAVGWGFPDSLEDHAFSEGEATYSGDTESVSVTAPAKMRTRRRRRQIVYGHSSQQTNQTILTEQPVASTIPVTEEIIPNQVGNSALEQIYKLYAMLDYLARKNVTGSHRALAEMERMLITASQQLLIAERSADGAVIFREQILPRAERIMAHVLPQNDRLRSMTANNISSEQGSQTIIDVKVRPVITGPNGVRILKSDPRLGVSGPDRLVPPDLGDPRVSDAGRAARAAKTGSGIGSALAVSDKGTSSASSRSDGSAKSSK